MRLEIPEPGSARDWLRRARSDPALARVGEQPDVMYNELCFHAQQAVEKSIKAILIDQSIEFRRAHNIAYLLALLPSGIDLPSEAMEAASLTTYAVLTRYPGDYEDLSVAGLLRAANREDLIVDEIPSLYLEEPVRRSGEYAYGLGVVREKPPETEF